MKSHKVSRVMKITLNISDRRNISELNINIHVNQQIIKKIHLSKINCRFFRVISNSALIHESRTIKKIEITILQKEPLNECK